MSLKPTIDWIAARNYFITHPTENMADVARKFGVMPKTVRNRASKENWSALRQQAISKSEVKLMDNFSDKLAQTNDKHASTYRQAQAYINRRLQLEIARAQLAENNAKDHVQLGNTLIPVIENTKGLMSPAQLSYLMASLKVAIDGERVALGLPTSVTKSENDLNINNPYANYSDDQLRRIIEITDAELKYTGTPEAELTSED